ncbi:hypothetical protein [Roseimicrobium sp. ORNL1]|uniref:hypothetical protein n=1 Tax=Roseimicrobium sp. ORNL1 TaxID=2711231 RepID=UPI0013E13578|nr:hypothetical protein [Roseimicrobium sp. ORNL1]QIF01650.1 hypothetical protein G5S37_08980 [Roseimicrobium sp. ORNL1]
MPRTSRIREDIARATFAFLEAGTKWYGITFGGMLLCAKYEPDEPQAYGIVSWERLTPQKVADALWSLKEQKGEDLRVHELTSGEVIRAWDEMILASP